MSQVVIRGEAVYECDVCNRRIRVPSNKHGLDVLQRCIITANCQGSLHRVTSSSEANATPAFPPEVEGVDGWFQRTVFYQHQQTIKAQFWTIKHNLDNVPVVHTFVNRIVNQQTELIEQEPLVVTVIDSNTVIVEFTAAESGIAHCVSLSSQNTDVASVFSTPTAEQEALQLSSNVGEVTIATLDDSTVIDLSVSFRTTPTINTSYTGVDSVVSIDSPWVGTNKVIINGRKYTVRSFNVHTAAQASAYFAVGQVPSGTAFYISSINGVAIKPNDMLFLLGRSPYGVADRTYNNVVDAAAISGAAPETFYQSTRAYVMPTVIKSVYPLIMVV